MGPDILGVTWRFIKLFFDALMGLIKAMLNCHYSRESSYVTTTQAHMMKLSNLLHDWSTKLRIKEHDQLDACVKSIPEWDKDTIMLLGCRS